MQLAGWWFPLPDDEKGPGGDRPFPPPAMCSVNEGGTDPLVARCRQLEETVEQLHRENKSLKSKVPRYSALCSLYHETGQQLKCLQLQLSAKEAMIRELKASLAKYQAAQLGAAQEEEQLPPPAGGKLVEPAKSLVDSLIDQLGQMKQQLKDSEKTSAQKVETLSQEVQKLNQQLEEKEKDIQQIISQPQYEKEREILRLQRSLAEREKVQATSEVLCRSLTDETHELQRKLASTAEMCQQLAKRLEEKQRKDRGYLEEHIPTERSNQLQFAENKTSLQTTICQLQEENRKLKQKVFHVEDLNTKWQAYDASREEYVKQLHLQLKDLKSKPEPQQGIIPLQRTSELMQKEISRLNKLLEDKMNECIKLKQETEDMKKARDEDSERVQMLEQQVLVYKDDFTSERADRERAQSKIQELQAEVACLQHQLTRRQDSRDAAGHVRVHTGTQNRVYVQTNVERLLGNSQVHSGMRRTGSQSEQAATNSGSSGSERRGQGELQCPHCMRFFNDELGDEFLRHVAECCQ
ncbi:TNFAIP3-interacting protein 2 [Carettochelys insculpta]|uniref:TNFAIP3-interacting protein 2 n=1 Tax=Carettochelys insculpta TaxID=44489 RepID=UPI003EBE15C8